MFASRKEGYEYYTLVIARFMPSYNTCSLDMLSDISFKIVDTLPVSLVPKTKLPYVPGWTDMPSLKFRCENNLLLYGRHLFKV